MRTMSENFLAAIGAIILLLSLAGCSTLPVDAAVVKPSSMRVDMEVGVEPFKDARLQYRNTGKYCFIFPLAPFGWYYFESPDKAAASGAGPEVFSPQRETQDILIDALKNSKIFKKVILINDPKKDKDGELIVSGRIIKASAAEKFWTYGLSIFGAVFWAFGLPVFSGNETYAVEVQISVRGETAPRWTFKADKEAGSVQALYYETNRFDKPSHGEQYKCKRRYLAEVAAAEFIAALDAKLREMPNLFEAAAPETPKE